MIVLRGRTPEKFNESLVFPLFKKGSREILDCYRTISLRPIISNYLLRSFLPTCSEITKISVLPFQFNRPKHNCQDNLFILSRLIDLCESSRCSLFLFFTDIKKAFDSVSRKFLFEVLHQRCPPALFSLLTHLHTKAKLSFQKLFTLTESGVLQGDTLAAILFVWVMDEIMRQWEKNKGKKWGIKIVFKKGETVKEFLPHGEKMDKENLLELILNWLGFADDIIFVSEVYADVTESFKLFAKICASVGLDINFDKCGLMIMEWNSDVPSFQESKNKFLIIDGHKIPIVTEYLYLGVLISRDGSFSSHVEERSKKALGVVCGRIKNVKGWVGKKNPQVLLQELNSCFAPCLAWGTDVITLNKTDELPSMFLFSAT